MEADIESCFVRYAIIEAIRTEAAPELFVISYRSEASLRLVIADFCIVATGFSSRQEAVEACEKQLCSVA